MRERPMHSHQRRRLAILGGALGVAAVLPGRASAQSYPARPVRMIVPFPPGGPVDTTARAIAPNLSNALGQPVIVENRAGAGGIVGAEIASKAPADGYTVFVCAIHHAVLPGLRSSLPYDVEKDFAPVTSAANYPVILVAHPTVPVRNVAELITYAKQNPGRLAYGSSGNGGGTHLAGELFASMAGVDLLHVPYKGSAPAMADLVGGQVQLMFADGTSALPQIRGGRVRALGIASPKRSPLLPDLPTIAESGVPGYEAYSWAGILVPSGTPADTVARLNAEIVKVLNTPEVRQRMIDAGSEAAPSTQEQFARMLRGEINKWARVIRERNIQPD